MANRNATEPQELEARLHTMVLALYDDVNDHPLLELGDEACTRMMSLITKDPAHKADEKRYRGFYSVVKEITKRFEDTQAEGNSYPAQSRLPSCLDKYRLTRLRKKLDANYSIAYKTRKPSVCKWEDAMILAGGAVSTISSGPGLDLLKPVGVVLTQIGELVKTIRGNRAEYADLHRLAAGILADLSRKMQRSDVRPTEDMECSVRDFERPSIRRMKHGYIVDRDTFQDWLSEANPQRYSFAAEVENSGEALRTNPDGDIRI
ncbi:hypothetical protein AAF712_010712 [Marasmius tenuissimus]|uniref:Uncharacterized protein n=1 Tax=Marasmius tenuissimus TaxID=585030 RepID=A0ABR2ZNX1_9AGAR